MTAESTLWSTLTADADVAPLILNSSSPETWRLFPAIAQENVITPFVVYTIITATKPVDLSDMSSIEDARFQIDVYDTTSAAARTLADHIVDAVNTNMDMTQVFISSQYENDVKLHRYIIDLSVWV